MTQERTSSVRNSSSMPVLFGTITKSVPVEAHQSIGIVERYHRPVRRAYQIVSEELPDLDKDAALQMAFKAINDTAGPDGIVPTLLVFRAYPRLVESDAPSQTVSHRATVLKKAMEEVQKLRAKRQVNDALNQRNGPSTLAIKDLPLNSDVLVWRETPRQQNRTMDRTIQPSWNRQGRLYCYTSQWSHNIQIYGR